MIVTRDCGESSEKLRNINSDISYLMKKYMYEKKAKDNPLSYAILITFIILY